MGNQPIYSTWPAVLLATIILADAARIAPRPTPTTPPIDAVAPHYLQAQPIRSPAPLWRPRCKSWIFAEGKKPLYSNMSCVSYW